MKRAFSTAALAAAIFLLLSSCNNEYGILSEIQTEQENSSASSFYRSSVQAFARINGKYFAVTNAIYSRPVTNATGSGWAQVSVGSLGSSYRCRSVAVLGGSTLYAVIRDTSDTVQDIYSSTDGSSFTALGSNLAAKNIQSIYAAGSYLFAVVNTSNTETTPTYALYYSAGGATFTATGLSGSGWIPGVAYDGGSYFVGQGNAIYKGDGTSFTSNKTVSGVVSSITGSDTNTRVYAGTTYGYVYGTTDSGTSWESTAPWGTGSADGDVAVVKALVYLPASNIVVAGRSMLNDYTSTFYGYYEIHLSGDPGLSSSTSYIGSSSSALLKTNYSTTTQYLFVNGFYYDSTASRLFILENSSMKKLAALWSNYYDGGAWNGWVTE